MPNLFSELLTPLRTTNNHSQLQISPTDLNILSVLLVITLFIGRQLKYLVGLGAPFRPSTAKQDTVSPNTSGHVRSSDSSIETNSFALPDLSLSMPLKFDSSHATTFNDAIRQDPTAKIDIGSNRALLALYFGALSEPAMLLLLCKRGCPVRPLGSVKVRHRFEILDLDACRSLFENGRPPATEALVLLAKFPRPARKVRKGVEVDVEVTMAVRSSGGGSRDRDGGETRPIFRQEMTILQFVKWAGKTRGAGQARRAPSTVDDNSQSMPSHAQNQSPQDPIEPTRLHGSSHESTPVAMARLTARSTRSWAGFCKDYNPIHVSPLLARLLGLSGVIAHGNHVVAACFWSIAHLSEKLKLGDSNDNNDEAAAVDRLMRDLVQIPSDKNYKPGSKKWAMELKFKSMLFLPAAFWPRVLGEDAGRFEIVNAKHEKVGVDVCIDVGA